MQHPRVDIVHYTDFYPEGKLVKPSAAELARRAIQSVKKAESGKDGITYLMKAMSAGITTPLTDSYVEQILALTQTTSLTEAVKSSRK
jgi:hypothetical protein